MIGLRDDQRGSSFLCMRSRQRLERNRRKRNSQQALQQRHKTLHTDSTRAIEIRSTVDFAGSHWSMRSVAE